MPRKIIDYDPGLSPYDSVNHEEQDNIIKHQKAWLEAEYQKREQERLEKQTKQTELASIKTSKTEANKLEKEADEIKKLYALDYFMQCFNRTSFYNEVFGQGLFHVVLGQGLSHKKLSTEDSTDLDFRIHIILIQDSSSGKGKGVNFVIRIFNHPKFKKIQDAMEREYRIHKLGRMNPASLINTYKTNKHGQVEKDDLGNSIIKYGIIEQNDVIYSEEGRTVLQGGNDALELQEVFMTATEPIGSKSNLYNKQLTDYETTCETRSSASFIFTSRPFGKMKRTLAESGLIQRFLFFPRDSITKDTMDDMLKASIFSFKRKKDKSNFDEDFEKLIDELMKVIRFANKYDIDFSSDNIDELLSFMYEKIQWFSEVIYSSSLTPLNKKIMQGIIRRYKDNFSVIAAHSAAMRFSRNIEKQDLQYAFDYFKLLFENQMEWISANVLEDREAKQEQDIIAKDIQRALAKQPKQTLAFPDLIKEIARKHRKSYQRASQVVKQFGPEECEYPIYILKDTDDKRIKNAVLKC
jgi:hypothetical protein